MITIPADKPVTVVYDPNGTSIRYLVAGQTDSIWQYLGAPIYGEHPLSKQRVPLAPDPEQIREWWYQVKHVLGKNPVTQEKIATAELVKGGEWNPNSTALRYCAVLDKFDGIVTPYVEPAPVPEPELTSEPLPDVDDIKPKIVLNTTNLTLDEKAVFENAILMPGGFDRLPPDIQGKLTRYEVESAPKTSAVGAILTQTAENPLNEKVSN